MGDFFYCVGRICDFFYRVSGFFFLRTGACFLLFVDVFHLSNNDAVKERKKGTFLQSAIDFYQYLLEFNFELNLENFS